MPKVFVEAVVVKCVNHATGTLRQEERPARRELGIVKHQKVIERLAIIEDVDLDRRSLIVNTQAKARLDVELECEQVADHLGVGRDRRIGEERERARARLEPARNERRARVPDRRAAGRREDVEGDPDEGQSWFKHDDRISAVESVAYL